MLSTRDISSLTQFTMDIFTCIGVTYKTGFGLDDSIYCILYSYIHNSGLRVIERYRWSTQFTVHCYTHTRVLSLRLSYPGNGFITVSLSLHIAHEVCFSQLNSLLVIILQMPTQFSWKLISWQAGVSNSTTVLYCFMLLNTSLQPFCMDHAENSLYYWGGVFTNPLPRNGRPIVARVCFHLSVREPEGVDIDPLESQSCGNWKSLEPPFTRRLLRLRAFTSTLFVICTLFLDMKFEIMAPENVAIQWIYSTFPEPIRCCSNRSFLKVSIPKQLPSLAYCGYARRIIQQPGQFLGGSTQSPLHAICVEASRGEKSCFLSQIKWRQNFWYESSVHQVLVMQAHL
jgi:hypothetical protein